MLDQTVTHDNSKALVLILIQLYQKLTSIHVSLLAVPLNKVLKGFGILQDCAQATARQPLDRVVACLNQI